MPFVQMSEIFPLRRQWWWFLRNRPIHKILDVVTVFVTRRKIVKIVLLIVVRVLFRLMADGALGVNVLKTAGEGFSPVGVPILLPAMVARIVPVRQSDRVTNIRARLMAIGVIGGRVQNHAVVVSRRGHVRILRRVLGGRIVLVRIHKRAIRLRVLMNFIGVLVIGESVP